MIRFASPWLLLLALVVVARVAMAIRDRKKHFGHFTFSSLSLVAPKSPKLAGIPFALECVAALLLVVAMARPQRVTRLAADDRIGIVVFGARAATRVPITYDRDVAQAILDRAQVGENGDGTAIGSAIATAVTRLRTSKSRSRIIILVTDGVNNSGSIEPMTAAQIAAKEGIKIYTLGVGSRGPVPIPIKRQDPFSGEIVTTYQLVRADIDEETLAAIAKTTGGEYFRATTANTMRDVLARIATREKTRLTAPKSEKVDELYFRPLAAGMLALALSLLGGETLWLKLSA